MYMQEYVWLSVVVYVHMYVCKYICMYALKLEGGVV